MFAIVFGFWIWKRQHDVGVKANMISSSRSPYSCICLLIKGILNKRPFFLCWKASLPLLSMGCILNLADLMSSEQNVASPLTQRL